MLSSSSRIRGECGLRGQQEDFIEWSLTNLRVDAVFNEEKAKCIAEKQAKQYIPAEISGYRRGWYARGIVPQIDLPQNNLFIRPTYLGIVKDGNYNTSGLLYRVTKKDLAYNDEREKDAGYVYETLSKKDITLVSNVNIPDNAKIRVYVSTAILVDPPTKRFPIVQSYVDVFLGGAIEIEENNPEMKNFSLKVCKQTYGWGGGWVNDRPYPRYRAAFSSLRAEKIDELLYRCVKANEVSKNEEGNIIELNSSLSPLTSKAINSITFPGMCGENEQ